MKRIKLLGLAFIAILSLTGILAASASAAATLPSILPEPTAGTNHLLAGFTSKKSEFGNGVTKIISAKDEGTLEGTSAKLGAIDILFLETKTSGGEPCLGLTDTAAESVLALGTYHLRDYGPTQTLRVALIVLLAPVHFECEKILFLVTGCVAGAVTPENVLTKFLTVTLEHGFTKADNAIITVLNEEATASELCQLLAKEGAGPTKLSIEETTELASNPTKNSLATEVLVMRL